MARTLGRHTAACSRTSTGSTGLNEQLEANLPLGLAMANSMRKAWVIQCSRGDGQCTGSRNRPTIPILIKYFSF